MNVKFGKKEVTSLIKVMDKDYPSMEEAGEAILQHAWDLYEARAKFAVVGQCYYSDGYLDEDDVRASRVILGPFSTRKQAEAAGRSLAYSPGTGEQSRWIAAALWHDTPAAWYRERQRDRQRLEQASSDDTPPRELRHQHVLAWMEANPGQELPDHLKGNGWEGLDTYMEWREDHAYTCPSCEGSGRIDR